MFNKLFVYLQYILPKHLLTVLVGWIASIQHPIIKNTFILFFIKVYKVNMSEAIIENPKDYAHFNDFFTRKLKPQLRPIASDTKHIVSPVDGCIAQMGIIRRNALLQVKNFYFDLETLLGNDTDLARQFYDGCFATFYLSPKDYHRVHMPLSGQLVKSFYVPGRLFSVNKMTSEIIPHLYSRNERLITLFETQAGCMAVILVGAIIVGSIQMVWMNEPVRNTSSPLLSPSSIFLNKGQELGLFKLGSTVIVLFEKNKINWVNFKHQTVLFGQKIGQFVIN